MSCSQLMHVVYTNCQPQPAPARPFVAATGRGEIRWRMGLPRYRWKVWQNPFKPLKNSSTYFAFLHSLNEGISPFWFSCCLGNKLFRDLLWPPSPPPPSAVAAAANSNNHQEPPPLSTMRTVLQLLLLFRDAHSAARPGLPSRLRLAVSFPF